MPTIELHCDDCAGPRTHEQPPCRDGHGGDCDEWFCTGCGGGLLIGSPTQARVAGRREMPASIRRAA